MSDVYANLSCGHDAYMFSSPDAVADVLISEEQMARLKDGWFAAVRCHICCRRRAVKSVRITQRTWRLKSLTWPKLANTADA